MTFSYNWLQSFFKRKLPKPEKMTELLTMHAFEVEETKKQDGDWLFDIDVLPNRAHDCFSYLGVARELAAILNFKFQPPEIKLIEDKNNKTSTLLKLRAGGKDCPRYTARVISGVKIGTAPKWIQEKLTASGLRPINDVVDIVNYVMLETGQPLHAFDFNKISSIRNQKRPYGESQATIKTKNKKFKTRKIIVRRAKVGEKITTLDEEKYDLDKDILIIADEKGPLAIAGIKGGKRAEIDRKTKVIVLEAANFDQRVIRRGSKKIDLKTDASLRFEQGLDPNLTENAINRAAALIQETCGGKIPQGLVDFYPRKFLPKRLKLDLNYVKSLLGLEIAKKEIKETLERLSFKVKEKNPEQLEVEIPTFRLDVSLQEDLIEEIGRIYGYPKIPSVFPVAALIPPKKNLEIYWEDMIKNSLKEAGFFEVYNYSFLAGEDVDIFKLAKQKSFLLEIENPTSADYQYLRSSLIPNLLKDVRKNQKFFREIKIFELGKIFKSVKSKPSEKKMLTGIITGDAFYQAKGVIDLLLNNLGISNIWYDEYRPTPEESQISIWHPQKSAEIKIDGEEIGFLGEISPKIRELMKIEPKVVVFDIDFEKLTKFANQENEYRPISPYPAAVRDIAVLVPKFVKVDEVLSKIEQAGKGIIRDVDLFDIYEGEEIGEGKKNLAFHIVYQVEDRTLSSEEIEKIQNEIIKALERESEWQVRK